MINNQFKEKIYLNLIPVFLGIICFLCLGITIAKYFNKVNLYSKNDIAKPIFNIENGTKTDITAMKNIGKYEFEVKNFDEIQKSDVAFEYTIEIISNMNCYIEYKLFKDGQEINLSQQKTDKILLSNLERNTHKYCLEITYIENKYQNKEDILDTVEVKINSEQKIS